MLVLNFRQRRVFKNVEEAIYITSE